MSRWPSWRTTAAMLSLLGAVALLQSARDRVGALAAPDRRAIGYPSAAVLDRLVLGFDALAADLYWVRAVQHYGSTRLSTAPDKQYDQLYPSLDLATSLDPRFIGAYLFGAVFLAEPPPGGPGRPDLAVALLQKGLRAAPERWELAQALGFVHYWWLQDYEEAAAWFARAAAVPDAPPWLAPLAATTLAEGGRRDSSRLLWGQIAASAESGWFRAEAHRRLQQLDAMDEVDRLQQMVDGFRARHGYPPDDWEALRAGNTPAAAPRDPTGTPYLLANGVVELDPGSRLFPLPSRPKPLR